jgi:hypothetical protein
VSLKQPEADCQELAFRAGYALSEPAEVALEDYARVLTRAESAEAMRIETDASLVTGVHVCRPAVAIGPDPRRDVEDFARDMQAGGSGGGLGWS